MSEWWVEYNKGKNDECVIFLDLYEMIFDKINIPLYYTYGDSNYQTDLAIDFWKPSGETKLIELSNPPILINADPTFQLIKATKDGTTVPNELVLNDLYQEAKNMMKLEKIAPDLFKIVISDYYRLTNSHIRDNVKNTWLVYRELPNFEKSIRYLVNMEYIRSG